MNPLDSYMDRISFGNGGEAHDPTLPVSRQVNTNSSMVPLIMREIDIAVRDLKNAAHLERLRGTLPTDPEIEAAQRQHNQQQKNSTISKSTAVPPNAMWMYPNLHGSTKQNTTEQVNVEIAGELIGAGVSTGGKLYRLNPNAYSRYLPENTMWRGLGKEGYEDAMQSGVFRAKQNVVPEYAPSTTINLSKQFGQKPYFTPKYNTAKGYGSEYIAEVPTDAADWVERYARSDWSQYSKTPIPIDKGRILKRHWWKEYAPVEYSQGGPANLLLPLGDTAVTHIESTGTSNVRDTEYLVKYFEKVSGIHPVKKKSLVEEGYKNLDPMRHYKNYKDDNVEEVVAIQKELIRRGYDIGKTGADGKFGDKTKKAYEQSIANPEYDNKYEKELKRRRCSKDGCAEYVSEVTHNTVLGDAWEMMDNIKKQNGSVKYNIYDEPELKKATSKEELLKATRIVKSRSKAKASMFSVGDVVGLVHYPSNSHDIALKKGRGGAKNTHVGIVTAIKNGKPVISHNIHGKLHHDNYDNLTIGWIANTNSRTHYNPGKGDIDSTIKKVSKEMPKLLGVDVDPAQLEKDTQGILAVESGRGTVKQSKQEAFLRDKYVQWTGGGIENKSIGIAKIKPGSLTSEEKQFLGWDNDPETIQDDIAATQYMYLKNLKAFREYAAKNPKLGLTEEDVRNMTILSHNQGTSSLLNTGANTFRSAESEVAKLRSVTQGKVKDYTSTNYRVLGKTLGTVAYNMEFPKGHDSYVGRVKEHGKRYSAGGKVSLDDFMDSIR